MSRISLKSGGKTVNGKFVASKSSKKVTKTAPVGEVLGASTTADLNAAQLGGARGEGFAEEFTKQGGKKLTRKGYSITAASQVINNRTGGGAPLPAAPSRKLKNSLQRKREKLAKKGQASASLTSLQRASNVNTTDGESEITDSERSGRSGSVFKKDAIKTGRGLTDDQVTQLERFGYREGDFVPNKGTLKPDGTFDKSSVEVLKNAEREALKIQEKVTKLREQEMTAANNTYVSDAPEVQEEKRASEQIKNAGMAAPTREALTLMDVELARLKDQLRSEMEVINSDFERQNRDLQEKQERETGATSVGLAQAGGYLGFTGSGTGVMLKLAESHRAELSDLDARRQKAINDARRASAERRFDIVRLKADEIARIDQETYERQEKYNERVREEAEAATQKAEEVKAQQDIFTAIQSGAKTAEDIFKKLGGTTDIKQISDFLENMSGGSSTGKFKYSATDTASLLGSGMSQDDISALNEFVNENGYTDEVRNALSPEQRKAADNIYKLKTGTGVDDGTDTGIGVTFPDGTPILSTTAQVIDGFTTLKELTPTAREKVRKQLYKLGFNEKTPPTWFDFRTVEESLGEEITQEFLEDYYNVNFEPSQIDSAMQTFTNRFIREQWSAMRDQVLSNDSQESGSAAVGNSLDELSIDDI